MYIFQATIVKDSSSARNNSPGSRSACNSVGGGGGYLSDGHGSGISSDNEDASICSEMITGKTGMIYFGSIHTFTIITNN